MSLLSVIKVVQMRKVLVLGVVGLMWLGAFSQQDYQVTHFMFDKLSVNPGFAGMNQGICATLIGRQQWSGLPTQPETGVFNAHAKIDQIQGGAGISYYYDKLGFETNTVVRLTYSYHKDLGDGVLGLGASVGFLTKSFDAAWITPDGQIFTTDPNIPGQNDNQSKQDFNFGAYYKANNWYAGISTTRLAQSDLDELNVENARHLYVMGGYTYDLNPNISLRPNGLIKSDFTSTQLDVNLSVYYRNMFFGGLSYRWKDDISPMIGYIHQFEKAGSLKIGYAYGVTTSQVSNHSNGSHEIMLNYCFDLNFDKPVTKAKHPRWL